MNYDKFYSDVFTKSDISLFLSYEQGILFDRYYVRFKDLLEVFESRKMGLVFTDLSELSGFSAAASVFDLYFDWMFDQEELTYIFSVVYDDHGDLRGWVYCPDGFFREYKEVPHDR